MNLWRRVLAERKAVAFPLLILVVANLAVLILVVLPLNRSVATAGEDAFAAVTGLSQARQLDTEARTAQARKANADVELSRFYSEVLPANLSAARNLLVFDVPALAQENGVRFQGSQSEFEDVRESNLVRVSNTAVLSGQYQNVLRFLYALETADEFVIIESVELAEANTTQQSAGGSLDLLVRVITYYIRPAAGPTGGTVAGGAPRP